MDQLVPANMVIQQIQFKLCYFCPLLQIFVYDHGPDACLPHIANDLLRIWSPNKYIRKLD